jgi:predicted MFS family arabinose efflux permease
VNPDGRIVTRPFVIGFLMTFFLYLAIGASIPLLPRLITNGLGGDRADVGRLAAVFSVAAIVCRPLLSLVSRRGARTLGIVGSVFSVTGFALMWRVPNLAVLGVSRVFASVGEALVWTAFGTLATANAPAHRQAEAVSLSSAAIFLAIGIGPLLTEPFARAGRFDAAVLVALCAALISAALSFQTHRDWVPGLIDRKGRLTAKELFHPAALVPGLTLGLVILGWSAWSNFIALRADEVGMANAAMLFTVYSVVSLGIRLLGAKLPERFGLRRTASAAAVMVAAGLLVLASAHSAAGLAFGAAVLSVGVALNFPALSALALSQLTDPSDRAMLFGSFGMFFEVGAGVGGLMIGPVARNSGLPAAFRFAAIAPLVALVTLHLRRRSTTGYQNGGREPRT